MFYNYRLYQCKMNLLNPVKTPYSCLDTLTTHFSEEAADSVDKKTFINNLNLMN